MRVLERTGMAAALVPERDNLGSRNLVLGSRARYCCWVEVN